MAYRPTYRRSFPETWRQLRKSRLAMLALSFLALIGLFALLANVIANSRPLVCTYNGKTTYPAFSENKIDSIYDITEGKYRLFRLATVDWRSLPLESAIWPLVPYSPDFQDSYNKKNDSGRAIGPNAPQFYQNPTGEIMPLPWRFRHWLGTTQSGQDVLSGLIHGCRISLFIAFISMGLAALIGIVLGALAGFYGDHRIRIRRSSYLLMLPVFMLMYFYGFYVRRYAFTEAGEAGFGHLAGQALLSVGIITSIGILAWGLSRLLARIPYLDKRQALPVDSIVSRIIEILRSVPVILILISFSILFKGSIWFVSIIIGLTLWTGIARLMRAEMLRIIRLSYLEAAKALGVPERQQIFRHALPNGLAPVLVAITFGMASAIIVESGLSFLGLGVGQDTITWGKLLQRGQANIHAWWLTAFPTLFIFLTVLSLNILGERLRDILDPQTEN